MAHYVYIIFSESHDIYYKGESATPYERLKAHNLNLSDYTKDKGPWALVYIEEAENRLQALKREKTIKKLNRRSIEKLLNSSTNILLKS